MSLRQKTIRGVAWSAIENFGRQAISFSVFFILARLLGPKAFGLVALASIFLAFIQIFLDQGLSQAIVQRQKLEPEHLNAAFWTSLTTGIVLTIFSILCASSVASLFKQPAITPIIQWLSLSFLLSAFSSVQQAILQRRLAFKPLAIRALVGITIGGTVGIMMAFKGFGVWSLVGQQIAGGLAEVCVLWWTSDWRPSFSISIRHYRELFSFGIYDLGFNFLNFLSRRGDDFLIGYFLGSTMLGYYSVAYRVLTVLTQLLTSTTNKVAFSTFSRLQQEPERMRNALYTATQMSSLIAFPAFLYVVALAPELVTGLFGSQWAPSIPVMQILALVGILQSVSYFTTSTIVAMGKPDWRLMLIALYCVTNLIAFALVLRWGIVYIAAAYVIRAYLFSPLPVWMLYKLIRINISTYLRQFVAPLLGSLAMVTCILGVKYLLSDVIDLQTLLVLCTAISLVVYAAAIYLVAPKLFLQVVDYVQLLKPAPLKKG